jgi:hypothetical protein
MLSSAERTYLVPQEDRVVSLEARDLNRTTSIPQEVRLVVITDRQTNSFERTVYVTED